MKLLLKIFFKIQFQRYTKLIGLTNLFHSLSYQTKLKMKLAIATVLAGSATAFAPSSSVSRSSVATNMAFESELGVQPPLGFFNLFGLLNNAD